MCASTSSCEGQKYLFTLQWILFQNTTRLLLVNVQKCKANKNTEIPPKKQKKNTENTLLLLRIYVLHSYIFDQEVKRYQLHTAFSFATFSTMLGHNTGFLDVVVLILCVIVKCCFCQLYPGKYNANIFKFYLFLFCALFLSKNW